MTKEDFEKNIIRMFDSLRVEYKGENSCAGIECDICPFDRKVCNKSLLRPRPYEAIEVVESWTEDHPVITNADKFREVFKIEPDKRSCVNGNAINCKDCEYRGDVDCAVSKLFWDAEYKGGADDSD